MTFIEIKQTILKNLRNNKAGGKDEIYIEMLKVADDNAILHLLLCPSHTIYLCLIFPLRVFLGHPMFLLTCGFQ